MKIAIDLSPLSSGHFLQHRVRGTGFYLTNLKESLVKYFPKNEYIYFNRGESLPKDVDVIHYPYFEPFFITLPFGINKKSVVTVHDLTPFVFPNNFPSGIKGKIRWQVQKKSLKKAGAIITDSNSSKKDIESFAGIDPSKIHVVYLAAAEHFKPQSESRKQEIVKKFNLPTRFVLYVGDATWNKNLPRLIEAINKTEIPLIIVGQAFANKDFDHSNPWNSDLQKAQELVGQNKNIKILGFVSNGDLAALYSVATLFVMPSLYEGFGLPILEAMASGCPVITSKNGSLKEVGGDGVYHIDPENLDSIEKGIEKVWNDTNLQKELSRKGLGQAKKFTWEKTATQTLKVYEEVASE